MANHQRRFDLPPVPARSKEAFRLGSQRLAQQTTYLRNRALIQAEKVSSRLALAPKTYFPDFKSLVTPEPEFEPKMVAEGLHYDSGKGVTADLDPAVCEALGLTPQNAKIVKMFTNGSEHIKTGVFLVDVNKNGVQGQIVVKLGPDVARELRVTQNDQQGPTRRHVMQYTGSQGIKDGEEWKMYPYIATPYFSAEDSHNFRDWRSLLEGNEVTSRQARQFFNHMAAAVALDYKHGRSQGFPVEGKVTSMQTREKDEVAEGLRNAAPALALAIKEITDSQLDIQPDQLFNMSLDLTLNGQQSTHRPLSVLHDNGYQVVGEAVSSPYMRLLVPGKNEDHKPTDTYRSDRHVVAAKTDRGYAADAHEFTIGEVGIATLVKGITPGAMRDMQLNSITADENTLNVDLRVNFSQAALEYQTYALRSLPQLIRRIDRNYPVALFQRNVYGHLGENYCNSIWSLEKKLKKETNLDTRKLYAMQLIIMWSMAADHFTKSEQFDEELRSQRRGVPLMLQTPRLVAA